MQHNMPHTILRSGSFVFNRRVPRAVQADFGAEFVRVRLGRNHEHAMLLAERLTQKLDEIWSSPSVRPVEVPQLLKGIAPGVLTFEQAVERYLDHRRAGRAPGFEKVVRIAQRGLVQVAGNKDIRLYDREDARAFVARLAGGRVKTATVRRRIDTIKAVFEFTFHEEELEKRNPFSRLTILGEGLDAKKRGTFTHAQLRQAYRVGLDTRNEIKLIVPILGETGARLAEIVGLRLEDIDLDRETITITPHPGRRLKTRGSERELPLVGAALLAMKLVIEKRKDQDTFLFPRYVKDGMVLATHASNAVNKWLRKDFGGLTCHCLRHTMRDRLRAVEAPMDMIDQIGGWSSAGSIGSGYGKGYSTDAIRKVLSGMKVQ